MAIKYVLVTDN